MRATRDNGPIALIGGLSGQPGSAAAAERKIAMTRIVMGSRQMPADLLRAIDFHGAVSTIDRTFAFDDLKGALARLESGQHFGKVVKSL